MFEKHYINLHTGEITEDRREAMQWYREGDTIEVYRNGKCVLTMYGGI